MPCGDPKQTPAFHFFLKIPHSAQMPMTPGFPSAHSEGKHHPPYEVLKLEPPLPIIALRPKVRVHVAGVRSPFPLSDPGDNPFLPPKERRMIEKTSRKKNKEESSWD